MTRRTLLPVSLLMILAATAALWAQDIDTDAVDEWVTATGVAAGTDGKAEDAAVDRARRKAVEDACGVFLTAQSKTEDYQATYDKVFANTVGYIRREKVMKVWVQDGQTYATIKARVSTQAFEEDWAAIAHTVEQEDNPRVIIAIIDRVEQTTDSSKEVKEGGIVQTKLEEFFLDKGLTLIDQATTASVTKRDLLLAAMKNDDKELASIGARFKADVVISGRATAKYGKSIEVPDVDVEMHQYTATLTVRVIQTDSGAVLVAKSFDPVTVNSLQRGGAEDKVLNKLAEERAPDLLAAVVKAWQNRENVHRKIPISISGMGFKEWRVFEKEAVALAGVDAVRRREITEGVAHIDVEYQHDIDSLAERLTELESLELEVTEITTNRIKLKVVD